MQSSCCNDPPFIVSTYNQICNEIEDQFVYMSEKQSKNESLYIVPSKQNSLWVDSLFNPFMTLPLGIDNIFIQVDPDDIGSIIAYALTSNVYIEGLYKMGYLGLQQPNLAVTNLETLRDYEQNPIKLE